MADISQVKLPNGDTYNLVDETSGYIKNYTETDPTVPSWAKQSSKPTYTAVEVGALPDSTVIPSKTSDLTNDSGFITTYTDNKVIQTVTTTNANYKILFSETADNTTRTEGAQKNDFFTFNPSTKRLSCGPFTSQAYSSGDSDSRIIHNIADIQLFATNGDDLKSTIQIKPNFITLTCQDDDKYEDNSNYNYDNARTSLYVSNSKIALRGNEGDTNIDYITVSDAGVVTITGLQTPTTNTDAANKKYVDDLIPKVYSSTNIGGYLTMSTLPIYDGTVV